jgi:hypothetical protein
MNREPVSIRMLLIPLNRAMARKARRQAPSAAASSALAGGPQRAGKLAHAEGAYHLGARKATIELIRDNRPHRAWDLPGALAIPTFVSILFRSGNADRFATAGPLSQARS